MSILAPACLLFFVALCAVLAIDRNRLRHRLDLAHAQSIVGPSVAVPVRREVTAPSPARRPTPTVATQRVKTPQTIPSVH